MELVTLGLFCGLLVLFLVTGLPMAGALFLGLLLFCGYALLRGVRPAELPGLCLEGAKTVRGLLMAFMLIGMLTGLWRAAGTIPVLVSYAAKLVRPGVLYLMTFLLNALVSTLIGTSFGTAATMGVVCAAMGEALGLDPAVTGGAMLAGAYVGDRCSPMSSIAVLVSALTGVDIYVNIKNMLRSCAVPFLLSCLLFGGLGLLAGAEGAVPDLTGLFSRAFELEPVCLIPAAVILLLSLCRVGLKKAIAASLVTAAPLCVLVQGMAPAEVLLAALRGFTPADPAAAALVSGGGITSMLNTALIVLISSCYSGIFRRTGLLQKFQSATAALASRYGACPAVLCAALPASLISCNQTLAIMLTHQLCKDCCPDREALALDLSDTAVVLAPLVPWSIAGAVPLATVGAPTSAIFFAFYLYLLPLARLAGALRHKKQGGTTP